MQPLVTFAFVQVFVVAHHDCGMNNINPAKTLEKMVDVGGIAPESE